MGSGVAKAIKPFRRIMRRRGAAALIAARLLRGKAGELGLNGRRMRGSSG
jgi:hypothetical protein